jgi:hypothetical protein
VITEDDPSDTGAEQSSAQFDAPARTDKPAHAPVTPPNADLDDAAEIARLAALPRVAYERERAATAKKLGMRATMLDKVVAAARRDLGTRALSHGR